MKLTATKKGIRLIPKTKRESFLPSDKAWLETNPKISLGEYIGKGGQGAVYEVKNRSNMIVKVPLAYHTKGITSSERTIDICKEENEFNKEWQTYKKLNLGSKPLIIPTKTVMLINNHVKCSFPGLVRPKVEVIDEMDGYNPTDAEIEQIRQKLIALSARGIALGDGLQIGRDRAGRIQLYDLGWIETHSPKRAAQINQEMWEDFLVNSDKSINKYGMVNPSGCGSAKYFS